MLFVRSKLSIAIIATLTTSAYANEIKNNDLNELNNSDLTLNTIIVEAKNMNEVGKTTYTKEDLKKTPNSSKNITDFLKVNPNVQFSNDHMAASNQAELKPSEISIHGAQSFQNKFIVNGVSNTNILDPLGSGSNTGEYGIPNVGSQGVAINTDLLCNLEVLDSNVSAKHGSFTGGVINAETCAPDTEIGKIHGSVTYDYTESDWNRYHLETDADKGLFEGESTQSNQKEYVRQGISSNLYGKLSDIYGFDLYASQRQSKIPVQSGLPSPKQIEQKKLNTNVGATLFANPNKETKMKFGFSLGDLEDNTYVNNRRNSHNTNNNKSALIFAEIDQQHAWGKLKQKLNYQNIDNKRETQEDTGISWLYAEGSKDWNRNNAEKVWEGPSAANIDLKQSTINYELDGIFNQFKLADTQHQISAGFAYHYDDVQWERTKDFKTFYSVTSGNAKNSYDLEGGQCQLNDPLCDENTTAEFINNKVNTIYNGQYFRSGNLFKAGKFDGQYQQASFYIEDDILWKNVKARFGVRADYDESNNNLNFAPRTNIRYQPFSNNLLTLTTGWNRYYIAPTYMTDLRQSLTSLDFKLDRADQDSPWEESAKVSANDTRRKDLKTSYADELVIGFNSQFKNTNLTLKWVNRQYKDEITRNKTDVPNQNFNYSYEYGNSGYGENDTVTLELNTLQPLKFYGTRHHLGLAVNYTDAYRSTPDYTTNLTEEDLYELISYDGKIMHFGDKPASNYNKPITARISWDIGFDAIPVKISNFFSYSDTYQYALTATTANKVTYEGKKIDTYNLQDIKPSFTWDIRTTYDWNIAKDYSAIFGLTINNLTNRNNLYVSNSKLYSEIGRQFIADVTFKF